MAALSLSGISAALATLFDDDLTNQFNRSTVLSQVLPFQPGIGSALNWDVRHGAIAASSVLAEGSDVTVFNSDTKAKATLAWGTYAEGFGVSGLALAAAASTGNPSALVDLFAEEFKEAAWRLASCINRDMYLGYTGGITGMTPAAKTNGGLNATGTYAGIVRGAVTQWAGNELANGGTARALSIDLMRAAVRAIYTASGLMPDLVVCDPIQYEKYGLLLGNFRRYNQDVTLRGQNISLDGGFKALEFDGMPVLMDKDCPAGQMVFLNSRDVVIRQAPNSPFMGEVGEDGPAEIPLAGIPESQLKSASGSLKAKVIPLAVLGDMYKFALVAYPQLQCKRPNACAILEDLLS